MTSKLKEGLTLTSLSLLIIPLLLLPLASAAPQQFTPGSYLRETFTGSGTSGSNTFTHTGSYNWTITGVSPAALTFSLSTSESYEERNSAGAIDSQYDDTETGTLIIDLDTRRIISSTHFWYDVDWYTELWIPATVGVGSSMPMFDNVGTVQSSAFCNGYDCWHVVYQYSESGYSHVTHFYHEKNTGIYLGYTSEGTNIYGSYRYQGVVVSTNIAALSGITGTIGGGFPILLIVVPIVVVIIAVSIAFWWRKRRIVIPAEEGAPETLEEAPMAPPTARFCPHCGAENLLEALFCANCGSSLEEGQAT